MPIFRGHSRSRKGMWSQRVAKRIFVSAPRGGFKFGLRRKGRGIRRAGSERGNEWGRVVNLEKRVKLGK